MGGSEPATDAEIINRSCADPNAFTELFRRHAQTLNRFTHRRLGPEDAEDVLMSTFQAAFTQRDRFVAPDHGSARPWLYGIASNLIRRHHRDHQRIDDLRAKLAAAPDAAVDDNAATIAALDAVGESLEGLNDEERETLLLVAVGDLSYEETAEALEIPIGTVRSRVSRARERMRATSSEGGRP